MFDDIFDQLAIFEGMDTSQRVLLKAYFVVCECKDEQVIFAQGDRAEFLYVVIEGEVFIRFKPDDGPELMVSRIKDGGVFGWSAAFGRGSYTSGATCTDSTTLLRVRGADLKMLRNARARGRFEDAAQKSSRNGYTYSRAFGCCGCQAHGM